jgi:PfaB family protein
MTKKIAIIGMSGLFPGSSTNEAFWDNLMQQKDLIGMATEDDFGVDPKKFYQAGKGVVDKTYSLRGGYIRNFDFDPKGYALSEDFLKEQDKLYQWSIYVAKEALAHSGYLNDKKVLEKCGVILGNLSFPTGTSHKQLASVYTETTEKALKKLLKDDDFKIPAHIHEEPKGGIIDYTPSQMVVDALNLGGTHYALDAACATSLYAIKLACDELLLGKSDMMLAGAVCASDQLFIHIGFSIFHAYAPHEQKFVPLDKNSAGLVSSEGAGMVALKRLEDAERDGDNILGIIGGIGLSNDGRGKFLLSPNPKGQRLAFERAYDLEEILPQNTSYLECHATGTPLGDVTELNSIANFFEAHQTKPLLGSVKSNMGHLLTAAGMTGLLKVLLAMDKELIPSNINLEDALHAENGWIGKEQMVLKPTEWKGINRQAGINSFGFGGTNAHLVVLNTEGWAQKLLNAPQNEEPITKSSGQLAIIGMDAHFGNCTNLSAFYQSIYEGKQHFRALPAERWKGFDANEDLLKGYGFEDGKAPKGAYIDNFEIDLLRYKIQPQEAETLEPQQALILKVADNALKDAGLAESQNVAVLIAMESELAIHHYLARWDVTWQLKKALKNSGIELTKEEQEILEAECKNAVYHREGSQTPSQHTSFVGNIMASRIAALWDFNGPAFTVSCGENSVLKALEIAQNMLALGEVEAVVVGGVDFSGSLENVLLRNQQSKINTAEKPSLVLNKNEKGWLIGEGAGAVVLKRSEDITKERVYALIDDVNGTKASNVATKTAFDYVELGNLSNANEEMLENMNLKEGKTALGSVQTNFGNTFAASGIASLIKTSLCLYHRFIPGIPNWQEAEAATYFEGKSYYFPTKSRPWIGTASSRSAAITGEKGIEIQLSERKVVTEKATALSKTFFPQKLFLLKGANEAVLQQQLAALEMALEGDHSIDAIAQQFYTKAKSAAYTIVLIAQSKKALAGEIAFFKKVLTNAFAQEKAIKTPKGSYFTANPLGKKGKVAFVYPGSATAYTGLGQDLFQLFPQLLDEFGDLQPNLDTYVNTDYLYPKTINRQDIAPNIYEDTVAMMSSGVFFSAAYTHVLRQIFGLEPQIAFGYSMGECSSMWYATGVWSATETKEFRNSPIFKNRFAGNLDLLAEHWKVSSKEAKANWVSLVVLADVTAVEKLVAVEKEVYLTFINTSKEAIISGDKKACEAIIKKLNCHSIEIPFQNVIHHHFCEKERAGLIKMHCFPMQERPNIDFYSSITQQKIPLDSQKIAENSTQVCVEQVNFPKTVENIYKEGARIFIEVGANATCTGWISEILKGKEALATSINYKGKSDSQTIATLLAQLISHGIDLDLSSLFANTAKAAPKRRFLKKINSGGKRIFDALLTEKMQNQFANITKKQIEKKAIITTTPVLETALVESTELAVSNALITEAAMTNKSGSFVNTPINTTATPINTPKQFSKQGNVSSNTGKMPPISKGIATVKNQSHNMQSTLAPTKKVGNEQPTIGENGLKIHDFSTGEHLKGKKIVFSQKDLEEFAKGKIANVFGPEYSIIDQYSRRVMLPMDPYLLVSRVTGLNAKMGEYKPSTMQTEYDIPHGAWFTTDKQIPWAVSVESGQCDLLLISYLGIDFQNKGNLVYRLLDCTLTFVDDLPFEGQTLRYDISINSFVRNGDNLLFFFSYRCYVEDRLVLKMDGGCAGFFTDAELESGSGVVYTDAEIKTRKEAIKKHFTPLLKTNKTSFSLEDLRYLIDGDFEKCFDDIGYYLNGRNPSLRLPPEKILMIDRITKVDIRGGAYGLGYIEAEKDLAPDDWYFPCHFRDDEVLAGSLQAEGGGNLLRFFMLYLGLQRLTKDARYQPVFDLPQKVRCRKQVVPGKDTKLIYKLEIKEIGLVPNPYVIGDLEIISNGVVTVHFENLGLQLREKDNPKYLEKTAGVAISPRSEGALLNEHDITTFALDDLSKCFGEEFAVYDGRTVSRQPNTDLQVISRIMKIDGERHQFKKPSTCYAEYDVPVDAWYYEQNSAVTMPYSVLMEIALQPCGLLGAYLGSTLRFPDKNLYFRNLDGTGEMFDLPTGTDFRGKTIKNKAVLASSVALGGTILQNYTFECSIDGHVFYKGKSSFGFFPGEALASQVGLDNGKDFPAWYVSEGLQPAEYMQIKLDSLYGKMKLFKAPAAKPHYKLAGDQLLLLDKLIIAKDSGKHQKGYIHATKLVNTYDWFFTCHFYQDPVMPGSLGVEAILQAMQVFALQQDLGKDFVSPKFVQLKNHKTVWKYRGQILWKPAEMNVEVHIKAIEKRGDQLAIIGDAYLWNGKMRIYQVTDLALGIEEA